MTEYGSALLLEVIPIAQVGNTVAHGCCHEVPT